MKTIKIIDLLIRCLENDETLPKKIKLKDTYYFLSQHADVSAYYKEADRTYNFMEDINLISKLNKEVEIIEEEKEIEKCDVLKHCVDFTKNENVLLDNQLGLRKKINELIDVVNELKGKSE